MNSLFGMAAKLGWIVGIFSLMVGGFGIANMLYVSVEERRPQIGICRALGAKRRVIVRQFLCEALALSLFGGWTGILFVQLLLLLLRVILIIQGGSIDFLPLFLSPRAIISGLSTALLIGLLFGVTPARRASRLAPVEAINK